MRKNLKGILPLLALVCFLPLALTSCSALLKNNLTTTVTLSFNAISRQTEVSFPCVKVELVGSSYNKSQTVSYSQNKRDYNFVFEDVPVGAKVQAKATVYTNENTPAYTGKSSFVTIVDGENKIELTLTEVKESISTTITLTYEFYYQDDTDSNKYNINSDQTQTLTMTSEQFNLLNDDEPNDITDEDFKNRVTTFFNNVWEIYSNAYPKYSEKSDYEYELDGNGNYVAKIYFDIAYHSVYFNSNKGSNVEEQIIKYGSYATEPKVPTKTATDTTAYTFAGWYKGTSSYDDNYEITITLSEEKFDFANIPITEDIILYAKWDEVANSNSITINFEVGSSNDIEVTTSTNEEGNPTFTPTTSSLSLSDNATYTWKIDETEVEKISDLVSVDSTTHALTLTPSLLCTGTYDILLTIVDTGTYYSWVGQLTISQTSIGE